MARMMANQGSKNKKSNKNSKRRRVIRGLRRFDRIRIKNTLIWQNELCVKKE
jgi:hypothetical protein